MICILKTVCDAAGVVVGGQALPLEFDTAAAARSFMDAYVSIVFEAGRSGYDPAGAYWWGCDETQDIKLHRYILQQ